MNLFFFFLASGYRVHVYHDGLLAAAETVHLTSSSTSSSSSSAPRGINEDNRGEIRLVGGTPSALIRGLVPFTEYMVSLSVRLSVYLSDCPSVRLYICRNSCLSDCPFMGLFVCLRHL